MAIFSLLRCVSIAVATVRTSSAASAASTAGVFSSVAASDTIRMLFIASVAVINTASVNALAAMLLLLSATAAADDHTAAFL